MAENTTTIQKFTGTRVFKGKRPPRTIGKVHDVIFHPNEKRVIGFITKRPDLLLMFKRKEHYFSVYGYYTYEDYAYVRSQKGSLDKAAYKALGLDPVDCVQWLRLPVVAENGINIGVVSDVTFTHQTGEVQSIEASLGAVGKLIQGSRTIPTDLIKGFYKNVGTALALISIESELESSFCGSAILVSNEALALSINPEKTLVSKTEKRISELAGKVGIDASAVSEKAMAAAETAGSLVSAGVKATGKQLEKTQGMFSAFKEEYDKARHSD